MRLLSGLSDFPTRFRRVMSGGGYVPQIDGLRFLAIIPVLFWHAGLRGFRLLPHPTAADNMALSYFPNGHVGVELFFFISGYIISYPFLTGRPLTLRKFFTRRLFRLEPPYFLVMILCFCLLAASGYRPSSSPTFEQSTEPLWASLASSLLYMHGIIYHVAPKLNPPAWSLEVEVQFYLLSPLIIFLYQRINARPLRVAVGAAIAVAYLIVYRSFSGGPGDFSEWNILGHLYFFLAGIVACDVSAALKPFQSRSAAWADLVGIASVPALLLTGLLGEHGVAPVYLIARDLIRLAAIVGIFAGAARGPVLRRALGNAWVTLVGGACYSIYLVHVPVLQVVSEVMSHVLHPSSLPLALLLELAVGVPVALAAGMVFYVLVERPCMSPDWPTKLAQLPGRLLLKTTSVEVK